MSHYLLLLFLFRPSASNSQSASAPTLVARTAVALAPPGVGTDAESLNDAGVVLLRQQRCAEALGLFAQAAAARPDWHLPHTNRGFCLYELDRMQEAIGEWQTAIRLNPQGQDAHAGLGMALFQQGDREAGLREYQAAITMENGYRDPAWLRDQRDWSARAIADSQPLRDALNQ